MNKLSSNTKLKKAVLPLGVLFLGAVLFYALSSRRGAPQVSAVQAEGVLVETLALKRMNFTPSIETYGTVSPFRQTQLSALVSGEVVEVAEAFFEGAFFNKGDMLFRIDPRDYKAALAERKAELSLAQQNLKTTEANAQIAREQWESLGALVSADSEKKEPSPLVLYKPQLESARARLAAAKATVARAKTNLERSSVKAPYNCFVRKKAIGLGQYVRVGESVAEVVGVDALQVIAPITQRQRSLLESDGGPQAVQIALTSDTKRATWPGTLDRFLAEVDNEGHMHQAVVRIEDPFKKESRSGSAVKKSEITEITKGLQPSTSLSIGSFVQISFDSAEKAAAIVIPRSSLRPNNVVWVFNSSSQLEKRRVEVERVVGDSVLIASGLEEKDKIVISSIAAPVDGMKLRTNSPSPVVDRSAEKKS